MGWKPKDGPSNYLLFKRGQRGDCEGNASRGRRTDGVWSAIAGEDAPLLSLVSAIKMLISIWEVHSGRQLKLKVWDWEDNEKAPAFCFCLAGGKKSTFNHFYPIWFPVETHFLFTYKWQSFCTLRSELVLRCKWFCMSFHVWDGWITSIYIVYEAHFYCDLIINDDLKIACIASLHRLEDALMTL